jgi:hypothetical protein
VAVDAVMDAHAIPFKEESPGNIVLFDVLHHLAAPAVFFLAFRFFIILEKR